MRKILFRGKRIDTGEWVEGGYYREDYTDYVYITFWNSFGLGFMDSCQVEPITVGQYTGLNDKNGKRIFEGDLLNGFEYPFLGREGEHNYFAEVVWFDNCPAFGLYTHKHPQAKVQGISAGNCEHMEDFDPSQWEVIGNIHDNPKLWRGKHEN